MKRKKILIGVMLFMILLTAVIYMKKIPGSTATTSGTLLQTITMTSNDGSETRNSISELQPGDIVNISGEEFYYLYGKDDGSSFLTLFSKYNLNLNDEDEKQEKGSTATSTYFEDTATYTGTDYLKKYVVYEGVKTTGADVWGNGTEKIVTFYNHVLAYENHLDDLLYLTTQHVTAYPPSVSLRENYNCITTGSCSSTATPPAWITDTTYWSMSKASDSELFVVISGGSKATKYDEEVGVRLIVQIPKESMYTHLVEVKLHVDCPTDSSTKTSTLDIQKTNKDGSDKYLQNRFDYKDEYDLSKLENTATDACPGYQFEGWYLGKNGTEDKYLDQRMIVEDDLTLASDGSYYEEKDGRYVVDLYGEWTPKYAVEFNYNEDCYGLSSDSITYDGTDKETSSNKIITQIVAEDDKVTVPASIPTSKTKTFAGWYYYSDATNSCSDDDGISWVFKRYTVSSTGGATGLKVQDLYGTPTQVNVNGETKYVVGKLTLYAQWYSDTTTTDIVLKFDKQCSQISATTDNTTCTGLTTPASQTLEIGGTPKEESALDDSKITDYEFTGWYNGANCTYGEFDFAQALYKNTTVYACWTPKYTVTFYDCVGKQVSTQQALYNTSLSEIKTPTITPASTQRFTGWYTDSEFVNEFDTKETLTKNMTLYAKCENITYKVRFHKDNDNVSVANPDDLTDMKIGDEVDKPKTLRPGNTYDGYTLISWNTEANCGGTAWDFANDTIPTGSVADEDDVILHLYGCWNTPKKTVTVQDCENKTITTEEVAMGSEYYVANYSASDMGTGFTGKYKYSDGTDITRFPITINDNITIVAQCEKTVNLTFDMQNHGTQVEPQTEIPYEGHGTKPTAPTAEHYTFCGWFNEATLDTEFNFNAAMTEDDVAYACWKEVTHKVTVYDCDGNEITDQSINEINEMTAFAKPTYTLTNTDKWYFNNEWQDKNGVAITFPIAEITEDTEIYATCKNKYSLIVKDCTGKDIVNTKVIAGTNYDEPSITVDKTYAFKGWKNNATQVNFPITVNEDTTITASCTPKYRVTVVGCESPTAVYDDYVESGSTFNITSTIYEPSSDWILNNWKVDDKVTPSSLTITQDTNFVADCTKKTYTVKFVEVNAPEGITNPDAQTEIEKNNKATEPSAKTVTCYELDGWYTAETGGEKWDFNTGLNDENTDENRTLTLYRRWTIKTVNVYHWLNYEGAGQWGVTQSITCGGYASTVTEPTRTDYNFGSWNTTAEGTTLFDYNTPIYEDTNIYASWNDIDKYDVNYVIGDCTGESKKETVKVNELAPGMVIVPEAGWEYTGWYTDDKFTTAYDFNTPVTKNITIYAKCTKKNYTVKFVPEKEVEKEIPDQTVEYDEPATEPENPKTTGYEFVDWEDKPNCSGTAWNFDTKINDDNTDENRTLTLYACWKEQLTVTYVPGDCDGTQSEEVVLYGDKAVLPSEIKAKEGYDFKGWYTDSALTVEFDETKEITENTKLYAKCAIKTFSIKYDKTNCESVDYSKSSVTYGTKYSNVSLPSVTAGTGYTFDNKWYTDENYTTEFDASSDSTVTGEMTLYAKCAKKTYIVEFEPEKEVDKEIPDQPVEYDEPATEPEDPENPDYVFVDWEDKPNCSSTAWDFSTTLTDDNTDENGKLTLYGCWKEIETVTYNPGKCNVTETNSRVISGELLTNLPTATPNGTDVFKGWYTDSEYKNAFDATQPITASTTLYALCTKKVVISYVINIPEGDDPDSEVLDPDTPATEPKTPTEEGYTFEGWYLDPELTIKWDFDENKVTEDTVLYAKWVPIENAGTYDNIITYVAVGTISVLGIAAILFIKKKRNI